MADKDVLVPGGYQQRFQIVATDDLGNPVLTPYVAGAGGGGSGGSGTLAQTFQSNPYVHLSALGTTVVKAIPGTLCAVIINKAGSADVLTIYDNTAGSGTILAILTAPLVGSRFTYDATMGTGITIVISGTTAGDYTVTFR